MNTTSQSTRPTLRHAQWIRLATAAERYDVSVKFLRKQIATGELPGRRAGRIIVVSIADLDNMFRPIPSANVGI